MKYNKDDITVTDSISQDVLDMAPYIRKDDVIELEATNKTPYSALVESYEDSLYKYTVKIKSVPVAMFGLNPDSLIGDKAKIWLIATDRLQEIQLRFATHSRDFIKEALAQYPVLYNYIDVRNDVSIKWLKWLGADFKGTVSYGINGEAFHYFEFTKTRELMRIFSNDVAIPPRKKIIMFEQLLLDHPDVILHGDEREPEVKHEFTKGIYTRTITIPKGMVLTGAIHKEEHPNFLMEGKVQVYTEYNGIEIIEAPQVIMSRSQTKRVVLTLEKTVWSTVHLNPTEERDPEKLRKMIAYESYSEIEHKEEELICQFG